MNAHAVDTGWSRRAQPLLGTLVEIGVQACNGDEHALIDAAFARVREVQRCLSRFEADSDVGRFHALGRGGCIRVRPEMRTVLDAASALRDATSARFDITLGSAPAGWRLDGDRLHKLANAVRLDLGGIGKGYAVDCAVQALEALGCRAGWVNAGGDLRSFGAVELPVHLRDERGGGARVFATLSDGAFATSNFDVGSTSSLMRGASGASEQLRPAHVSVAAPLCMWADALTKAVAASGDAADPVLARYDAQAWIH